MTRITKWRIAWAVLAVALIATLPFTVPFRRWLFDFLPLLVLLACPLIHLVMHRRHGSHAAHAGTPLQTTRAEPAVVPRPSSAGRVPSVPTVTGSPGHAAS